MWIRMRLLGAQVHSVSSGTGTLKDAMNEALRFWVTHADSHFYIIGTGRRTAPLSRHGARFSNDYRSEAKAQILEAEGRPA